MNGMKIEEAAREAGVNLDTIRYYKRRSLLAACILWSLGCSAGPGMNCGSSVPSSQPIAAHTATIEVLGLTCPT